MGNTIQKLIVMPSIGNYIHRVNVIKGSLYSRVYGMYNRQSLQSSVVSYTMAAICRCKPNFTVPFTKCDGTCTHNVNKVKHPTVDVTYFHTTSRRCSVVRLDFSLLVGPWVIESSCRSCNKAAQQESYCCNHHCWLRDPEMTVGAVLEWVGGSSRNQRFSNSLLELLMKLLSLQPFYSVWT